MKQLNTIFNLFFQKLIYEYSSYLSTMNFLMALIVWPYQSNCR